MMMMMVMIAMITMMNNGQYITMCALFLCNGFADLAVSINNYDDDDDCADCDDNDDEQCTMHNTSPCVPSFYVMDLLI